MRQTLLAAAAAFVIGGIATGAALSQAQPAPPVQTDGTPPPPGMGWAHHMREGMMHHRPFNRHAFALIYRQKDRQLAPADVQKIVEGFLLWNGNHTWKVINVKPEGDVIGFDLATPENSVIAHFTMDPKTGRPARPS